MDKNLLYEDLKQAKPLEGYQVKELMNKYLAQNYMFEIRRHGLNKEKHIANIIEILFINQKRYYFIRETTEIIVHETQQIATQNCMYEGEYNDNIIAVYETKKGKNKIIQAWKIDTKSRKLEKIKPALVSYNGL